MYNINITLEMPKYIKLSGKISAYLATCITYHASVSPTMPLCHLPYHCVTYHEYVTYYDASFFTCSAGYSQGGIISRGIVESLDHNITTFISLSSPQAGQYGDDFLRLIFPQYIKETAYEVFYSRVGQRISVANYWNDPHHQDLYYKYSNYLPYLNNEISGSQKSEYLKNFMKLKKLVLIGGPDDGVITPWQSSHFGYFDKDENVTEMRDQVFYQKDLFGLRTLDKAGKIKIYEVAGVYHTDWHHNVSVIKDCILPWLD
ncbi:lysosomal thioesterase PPT2-A-like isoform X2 [Homarus americanus]|uniref:lysosomal thioesterase PPT2-A-like isoform X2 n=1 Tax=Homarus americanus TaxID=6706 RepID=UPI001C44D4F1|nr:lysosomal thioesterase PPT2-A-like isoform X2 [Homarus americanus]XP_042236939.1 lysosomal thioesterase PPT2-A-like isoform X2 [Homarus americanus]